MKLASNGKSINTVIGRGSVSEGRFHIETGVRVDGVLKGELVSSGILIVGESGVIEADVRVREALISGRVVGDLIAENKVHLQANATFIGKVQTRILVVEEGAVFKAECDAGSEIEVATPSDNANEVASDQDEPVSQKA